MHRGRERRHGMGRLPARLAALPFKAKRQAILKL